MALELGLALALAVALTGFSIAASRSSLWTPPARPATPADPSAQAPPAAINLPVATAAGEERDRDEG
jgi:hypothetical protein